MADIGSCGQGWIADISLGGAQGGAPKLGGAVTGKPTKFFEFHSKMLYETTFSPSSIVRLGQNKKNIFSNIGYNVGCQDKSGGGRVVN